ncbi:MAG: chaperone modulator CbpM [Verrucomicrobiota bacterium]
MIYLPCGTKVSHRADSFLSGNLNQEKRMNDQAQTSVYTIQRFEPAPNTVYSIESTANIGGVSRRTLVLLYKYGILTPVMDPQCAGYCYNDEAIRRLRRIAYLQNVRGVNLPGIQMILEVMEEMDRLRSEVAALHRELDDLATL